MLKDLILFRRYGRQIVGDILEDKFVFQDDDVGSVTHRQAEISYITLTAYGNKDEMRLVNPTTYVGKVLTDSISIILAGSSQRVTAEMSKIKLIKFNWVRLFWNRRFERDHAAHLITLRWRPRVGAGWPSA